MYEKIISNFPKKHMAMSFAYGSAVFKQFQNFDQKCNMIDLIFVVDNAREWHSENLKRNRCHYSSLRYLGPNQIASVQEKFGARVYYNSCITVEDRLIKYGVISTNALIRDLMDWETLYISGRMHKPLKFILQSSSDELDFAVKTNYQNALHAALILLSDDFSEQELYETIAGVSYAGDFRMTFGENKNKVQNIVKPNIEHFRDIYGPLLDDEEHVQWNKLTGNFQQNVSPAARYHHLNLLPKMLQLKLINRRNLDGKERDAEEVFHVYSHDYACGDVVRAGIREIVRLSSWSQSFKGLFTAGLFTSFKYSMSKIRKMKAS